METWTTIKIKIIYEKRTQCEKYGEYVFGRWHFYRKLIYIQLNGVRMGLVCMVSSNIKVTWTRAKCISNLVENDDADDKLCQNELQWLKRRVDSSFNTIKRKVQFIMPKWHQWMFFSTMTMPFDCTFRWKLPDTLKWKWIIGFTFHLAQRLAHDIIIGDIAFTLVRKSENSWTKMQFNWFVICN